MPRRSVCAPGDGRIIEMQTISSSKGGDVMRKVSCSFALALFVAIAVAATPSTAQAGDVAHVDGGGTGLYAIG